MTISENWMLNFPERNEIKAVGWSMPKRKAGGNSGGDPD